MTAASLVQGWRCSMEDTHIATTDLEDGQTSAVFAVFDGHGGRCACLVQGLPVPLQVGYNPKHLCFGFDCSMSVQNDFKLHFNPFPCSMLVANLNGTRLKSSLWLHQLGVAGAVLLHCWSGLGRIVCWGNSPSYNKHKPQTNPDNRTPQTPVFAQSHILILRGTYPDLPCLPAVWCPICARPTSWACCCSTQTMQPGASMQH